MGRVDDDAVDLKVAYLPVKTWILQRDVKLKLRKHTRAKPAVNNPDDMIYGVDNARPSAGQVVSQPAAASADDPWHAAAAASDPWAASPAPPGEGAAAAAWPPQSPEHPGGDLDAVGKGKGKALYFVFNLFILKSQNQRFGGLAMKTNFSI